MTIVGQRISTLLQCNECSEVHAIVTELGSPTEGAFVIGGLALVNKACDCGRIMQTLVKFGGTDA